MAVWSDIATWIGPTVNRYPGGMSTVMGVVLHIQDGSEAGTEAWQHDPKSQVSSHFLAPRAGGLRQMVDTADGAWAEVSGNLHWLSIECEGFGGQSLTPGQIEACAQVLARAHHVYGVPLQNCDSPNLPGLGGLTGHGLGGAAWGGHYDCPGNPVLAQRDLILTRATEILGAVPTPHPEPIPAPTPSPTAAEDDDAMALIEKTIPLGFEDDARLVVSTPPAHLGPYWGDVHISFGSDWGTGHIRVAAWIHGGHWQVFDDVAVPSAGDRINPWGGLAPVGIQKISIKRVAHPDDPNGAVPMSVLVEAVKA